MDAIDRRRATGLLRTFAMLIAAVAVAMTAAVLVAGSAPAAPPDGKGPPDGMGGHDETTEEYVAPASLYRVTADGTTVTRLTQGTADEYNVWSDNHANVRADGAIVFSSTQPAADESTDAELWLLAGGELTQLTDNTTLVSDETGEEEPIQDLNPAFSSDGTKVAYQRAPLPTEEEEGEEGEGGGGAPAGSGQAGSQIFVLDLETGVSEQLTTIPASVGAAKYPTWSPDGTTIAFTVGDGTPQHLAVVDVATKVVTDLTAKGSTDSMPAWSPDGTKIAFTTGLGIAMDIHVIDVATKVETVLAATEEMESEPAWSPPDGTQIAYQRGDESLGAAIFVMDADGSDQTRITTATSWSDRDPAFAPDGTIVFESTRDAVPAANLGVTKTGTPLTAVPGQDVTYVVSVVNGGPLTATGVTVVDTIPTGMQYVSATAALTASEHEGEVEDPTFTPTVTVAGNVVTVALGDLPKSEQGGVLATITIVAKATTAGTFVNTAVISLTPSEELPDLIDPIASNNTATATTTVVTVPVPPGGTTPVAETPGGPPPETSSGPPLGAPGPFLPPTTAGGKQCTIVGTAGKDVLTGTAGRDVICGLGGDDVLRGLAGNDLLIGGTGNDLLVGGVGNDVLNGQAGNDRIDGSAGNDVLYGGAGNDVLTHVSGVDKLYAGSGNDTLFARDKGYDWVNGGLGRDIATIDRKVDRTFSIEAVR